MCGIFCCCRRQSFEKEELKEEIKECLALLKNRGPDCSFRYKACLGSYWSGFFCGFTLWTQGSKPLPQPLTDNAGNIFLWNGDAYFRDETEYNGQCDAEIVFSKVKNFGVSVLSEFNGPFSFIFYDNNSSQLWVGRDIIGRHSLLWQVTEENITISSVCTNSMKFDEVPYCGIFSINLATNNPEIELRPWAHLVHIPIDLELKFDCKVGEELKHVDFHSSDYEWIGKMPSSSAIRVFFDYESSLSFLQKCHEDGAFQDEVTHLSTYLLDAVKVRVEACPNYCKNCLTEQTACPHPKLAILYSGGLDSSLLALVADKYVTKGVSIDLFNVAFEQTQGLVNFLTPDRKTGLESLEELRRLTPGREWNFVMINITQAELQEFRSKKICHLIHPLNSILDDSLGCALWFAARGCGLLNDSLYSSPARIVLLGIGADEMFGGYRRHRLIFEKESWNGLGIQLLKELRCIGKRNMGRDNRVISDHGVQPRAPFLDEKFINFVDQLPPWKRCYLGKELPLGIGDKFLLRLLAWHFGLRNVAVLQKRALQFGSRIANPKEKGHLVSQNLKNVL